MQYQHIGHKIKGFYHLAKYASRYLAMPSDRAKHKQRILQFWNTHGLKATMDAFQISRRTLFLWKRQLVKGAGKIEALEEKSKRPHHIRKRQWPQSIIQEISRLREKHPNLGKEKLFIFLKKFCDSHQLKCPGPRTIGRIMADAPNKMRSIPVRLKPNGKRKISRKIQHKIHKPKGFRADHPGHCAAFDTIERFIDGCRRYVITFTDVYSRFAFAFATTSHASLAARQFFLMVIRVFPFPIEYVLTDQGSEFKKAFADELNNQHKIHWHTYPKTPKMNAHSERFNRTIQEEFVEFNLDDLAEPSVFNKKLVDYLIWYNAERPHWALGLKSPIQFLMVSQFNECNMWWPNTQACKSYRHHRELHGQCFDLGMEHPQWLIIRRLL